MSRVSEVEYVIVLDSRVLSVRSILNAACAFDVPYMLTMRRLWFGIENLPTYLIWCIVSFATNENFNCLIVRRVIDVHADKRNLMQDLVDMTVDLLCTCFALHVFAYGLQMFIYGLHFIIS